MNNEANANDGSHPKEHVELDNKTILITGVAGFIGYHLTKRLAQEVSGAVIVGIDNLNGYYDPALKKYRLKKIEQIVSGCSRSAFKMIRGSIADREMMNELISEYCPAIVVNLAAQAGVRYSIAHPDAYIESNVIGFYNILEACRHSNSSSGVEHLVYASSSSVYGGNWKVPFSVADDVSNPVSLYAATKKSDELLAHVYSKLYDIPSTGLRFFTVYGPAGRPDMAYYRFTEKLRSGENIQIFNHGNMKRDFTYIDDIVEGIVRVMRGAPVKEQGLDGLPVPPYAIYNIGGGLPENLMDFVKTLEFELKRVEVLEPDFHIDEHLNFLPMQPGDVPITYADSHELEQDYGFRPTIDLRTGLRHFAEWYKEYYG